MQIPHELGSSPASSVVACALHEEPFPAQVVQSKESSDPAVRTCLCQLRDTGEDEPLLMCFGSAKVMD